MERVSRRRLLAAGGGAVLAGAMVGTGVANAQGRADVPIQSPWALTLDIGLDPRSMDAVRQPGAAPAAPAAPAGAPPAAAPPAAAPAAGAMATGPAYIGGTIYRAMTLGADGIAPASAARIGTFRSTAWIFNAERGPNGGMMFIASFELTRRGEIVTAGWLHDRVAVTAGTGAFRGANGQADMDWLGENAFRIWFDIATP